MTVFDSTTRAYRLDGNVVSEESLDIVINAAYAMLASNDEIAPPFEEWDDEEIKDGEETLLCYFATTDTGKEIRMSFSMSEEIAKITLASRDSEFFIGDRLLCTLNTAEKYTIEDWL